MSQTGQPASTSGAGEAHWERVYRTKQPGEVSWFTAHLERSVTMIQAVADTAAAILDVGGGASTLVDDLLALGYTDLSVLDLSGTALDASRRRLGPGAEQVKWIIGDVTRVSLCRGAYDVWHDRAVFHFLTSAADRRAYVDQATASIRPGGHAIVATFALDGPARCSGLDVVRYDAGSLARELGPAFILQRELRETHLTPGGAEQRFLYCLFERAPAD